MALWPRRVVQAPSRRAILSRSLRVGEAFVLITVEETPAIRAARPPAAAQPEQSTPCPSHYGNARPIGGGVSGAYFYLRCISVTEMAWPDLLVFSAIRGA